jgi:hypothetical protein
MGPLCGQPFGRGLFVRCPSTVRRLSVPRWSTPDPTARTSAGSTDRAGCRGDPRSSGWDRGTPDAIPVVNRGCTGIRICTPLLHNRSPRQSGGQRAAHRVRHRGLPSVGARFAQLGGGCRSIWRGAAGGQLRTARERLIATHCYRGKRDGASLASTHRASTGCPPSPHQSWWLSTRCGGPRRQSISTVSRVSQTPLYDQLRGERLNADVPASHIEVSARETQQQLTPSGPRLVPAGGTVAVAGHGVFSGSQADLTAEGDGSGRHHRRDGAHGGAGCCRRQGAEAGEDGSGMAAPVPAGPAAPMPSEGSVAQQADPSVDTPAVTRASGAGPRRASRQLPAALVRSPVHGRTSQPQRGC